MKQKNANNKKNASRRIVALGGVILLVLLYIVALLVAIFDSSQGMKLFAFCIGATLAVPLMIWIYTWLYGKFTGKPNITDGEFKVNFEEE